MHKQVLGLVFASMVSATALIGSVTQKPAASKPAAVAVPATSGARLANATNPDPKNSFKAQFDASLAKAGHVLKVCKEQFAVALAKEKVTYLDTAKFTLVVQDPADKKITNALKIMVDFGHAGHGDLGSLRGAIVALDLPDNLLNPMFQPLLESVLQRTLFKCKDFVPDPKVLDPETRQPVTVQKSSEAVAFFFKVMLLGRDFKAKTIDFAMFRTELFMLMLQLAQVQHYVTFADVLKDLPGPLTPIFDGIVVKNKKLLDYLASFWTSVVTIVRYNFDEMSTEELQKDAAGFKEVRTVMMAIVCRFTLDFLQGRATFLKTTEGKVLAKVSMRMVNKAVPERKFMLAFAVKRTHALATRFSGFVAFQAKMVANMKVLANKLLEPTGTTIDELFPPAPGLEEELDLSELDMSMDDDMVFGDGDGSEVPADDTGGAGEPAAEEEPASDAGGDVAEPAPEAPADETAVSDVAAEPVADTSDTTVPADDASEPVTEAPASEEVIAESVGAVPKSGEASGEVVSESADTASAPADSEEIVSGEDV